MANLYGDGYSDLDQDLVDLAPSNALVEGVLLIPLFLVSCVLSVSLFSTVRLLWNICLGGLYMDL